MEAAQQLQVYLEGRVQGVGMRFYVDRLAKKLSLKGFVRNLPDGRVQIVAEGEKTSLKKLIEELSNSPRGRVDNISSSWHFASSEFETFEIRS